ncbi:hypothetical protein NADFUDRAFT_67430 [Nadsonia fulvescens var. elongata DSM 6958]|uniref:Uncharacterized protein n=1 Tax=Nadsonia fulvescens var. elongata DSM 6958 TaxID=857566 RepID=A0A1E3PFD9_9ASCO|nr:hypothetical protein NADFUDRAFT_67430 [Nadsonia fulvescens var. elongata DSM 6958]
MDAIKDIVEATIDYEGQKKAYKYQNLIIKWGANIAVTVYGFLVTGILTAVVVVYPWNYYRKNPINWQVPGLQAEE